jgi:hypothetical protein
MSKFDPIAAGFVLLPDFKMAPTLAFPNLAFPNLAFYELGNHAAVDGKTDMLRLNVYRPMTATSLRSGSV